MDFFPSVGQVPQMGFSRVLCMDMCGRPGRQLVGADTCTYLSIYIHRWSSSVKARTLLYAGEFVNRPSK